MNNPENSPAFRATRSSGFTLVELAICLCIVGIFASSSLLGVSAYFGTHRTAETRQRMELVMNALSVYVQTHDRLPCPADAAATPARAGRESERCPADGIIPWKELAVPQNTVIDGWGRYLAYSPAHNLTADMRSEAMQDVAGADPLDVGNACRSAMWYDADGNHANRAKALFCCNAPRREEDIADAATAAAIEPAAGSVQAVDSGSFSIPRYMDGPASPLRSATGPAVTLASRGEAGDITLQLRSDQLYARAGSGSCEYSPAANLPAYACKQQFFRSGDAGPSIRDPDSGKMFSSPPLYNVQLGLTAKKYRLRVSLKKSSDSGTRDDSLGFYEIGKDGNLQNVQILVASFNSLAKGETRSLDLPAGGEGIGMGLFIIPDGFNVNDGYKSIDLSHLKFISGYALYSEKPASITDQLPPILVSVDPATGFKTAVTGAGQVSAYHLYGNLNPGHAGRTLRPESTCRAAGQKAGVNGDIECRRPTAVAEEEDSSGLTQIGFEDSPEINCYEYRDGNCKEHDSRTEKNILSDGEGGYIASVGDDTYDDVAFTMGFSACPRSR